MMKTTLPLLQLDNHPCPGAPRKRLGLTSWIRARLGVVGLLCCLAALGAALVGATEATIAIGLGGALLIAFASDSSGNERDGSPPGS